MKTARTIILAITCLFAAACTHKAIPSAQPRKVETTTQSNIPSPQAQPQPQSDATVATPFGEVKVSDFYAYFNSMYVSTTKVYSAPDSSDGHTLTIDGPVYLMEKSSAPEWIHVATEDAKTFWINASQLDPEDYYHGLDPNPQANENGYVRSLRREKAIIGKGNDWKRRGPVLAQESPGGRTFADGLGIKGPWYSLHAVYPQELSLVRVQYYEGQSFILIDKANGKATNGLLSEPFFSSNGELFVTCGSFYDDPTKIGVYERGASGFSLKQDIVVSEGACFSLQSVRWCSATTADLTLLDGSGRTPEIEVYRDVQGTWHLKTKE